MNAYTVEIREINVVFVPEASDALDAERQAHAWIEAHATGEVQLANSAILIDPERETEARLLADSAITQA